jgi:hypothetical protein
METIEHFAKISLVTRMLGQEHLLSREEVDRLQGLRGMYGISSPAPVCADDTVTLGAEGQVACQVVQAPESSGRTRLVVDTFESSARGARPSGGLAPVGGDGEIRLTYRELTALIEDAVRNLR